jgi:tetratricopeptide (TPR) repeat protein
MNNPVTAGDHRHGTEPEVTGHSPGAALRGLLQRAGLSPEQFARRLSQLAGEQGLARRVDDKTPYKWFRGKIPRHPWPALAAHELSARLGSQVTAEDLGWGASTAGLQFLAAGAGLDLPWTVHGALTALGRVTSRGSPDQVFLPPCGTALTAPALGWLTAGPAGDPSRAEGRRVGTEQADDFQAITARLRRMGDRHGSGLVLPLAEDCARHLTGILAGTSYTAGTGIALYCAAAGLHLLAGGLCHDAGRAARAHRHWLAGLRASHAASDRAAGAAILAAMSAQASAAGHAVQAIQLARAAQRGHPAAGPRLAAVISLAAARAHAAAGEAAACRAAITDARQALAAGSPDTAEPDWAARVDDAAACAHAGAAYLSLRAYAEARECLTAALHGLDPVARARDTALTHARLALACAGQNEPEPACRSAAQAAAILTSTVDSPRCVSYLRELHQALRPYRHHEAVTAFATQATALLASHNQHDSS